jgi:hypothetical protein
MSEGGWGNLSDAALLKEMRGNTANSLNYQELAAEMQRRLAMRQMSAATAQIWAAWLQGAAVVVMAATLIWTVLRP